MDQPCYKCGQVVEEGRVFCPHCGAPQIRVLVAEPLPAAAIPRTTEGSSSDSALPAHQTVPVLALPVQWSQALKPCFLAALIASVLMVVGLHPFAAMPAAGFLSVVFYRQGRQNLAIRRAAAARVGAFGGLLHSGIVVFITALAAFFPEPRAKLHEEILNNVQRVAAAHADNPQLQELLHHLNTPDGFAVWLILCGVLLLILSVMLGGAGGAVAGAIFGRGEH
jgi:hypothetical protein